MNKIIAIRVQSWFFVSIGIEKQAIQTTASTGYTLDRNNSKQSQHKFQMQNHKYKQQ